MTDDLTWERERADARCLMAYRAGVKRLCAGRLWSPPGCTSLISLEGDRLHVRGEVVGDFGTAILLAGFAAK